MKSRNFVLLFIISIMMNLSMNAQVQTLTLQPGPSDGKDALIRDDFPTTPFGDNVNFTSNAWTVGGNPCILRSLIYFDLSAIPASATILNATLSLYCNIYSGIYQLQYGDNESYLLRVTENWDEHSVTWVTQPNTTFQNSVLIPTSTSSTQDYPDIDVTVPVQEMILNPSLNLGWMLQLVTEVLYRSMVFASSDNSVVEWRPKLVVKYQDCPLPNADFLFQIQNRTVSFTDQSSSAQSWNWVFGDGGTSNLQNPVHTYPSYQSYIVSLTVQDSCGTDTFTDTVELNCPDPVAHFNYEVDTTKVNFFDSSSSATSWYWSFGDGYFSNLQDPVHEYSQFGKYYVCLQIQDSCGNDEYCDTVYVCESPGTKFSCSVADHFVDFRDLSFGAIYWYWSFGDGFYSDLKDPLHYFNEYGTYYVCLTSENGCTQKTYCDSVNVKPNGVQNKYSSHIKLFPNPASDFIFVSAEQEYSGLTVSLEIIDQRGIIRRNEMFQPYSNTYKIDISDLSSGLYCLRIISDKGVTVRNFLIL